MKTRRRTACPFEILGITESLFVAVLLLSFILSFSMSYYSSGSKCIGTAYDTMKRKDYEN